jgi:tRNA (guanine-N7-)-methyltransferase
MAESSAKKWLPSFGRRIGRSLKPHRKKLLQRALPQWECPLPEPQQGRAFDAPALFGNHNPLWLEIGFGAGEHLEHLAKHYPAINFIGAEPFMNGVVRLLSAIEKQSITNIRILPDDVRLLLESLPDASLDRVDILFPDPWRKSRHYKRRLIQTAFLDMLARVMKPHATLWLATDHEDYSVWMLEQLLPHPAFIWQAGDVDGWHLPPEDWHQTRYESKGVEAGRPPVYLHFSRAEGALQ